MNKPVKIALFGIGKMGQNHLRILSMLRNVEIAFIYDTNENLANECAKKFGVRVSSNLDSDLQGLDGAIIVTPTFTHFDYINKLSDYVKNIFVEKPLTNTLESSQIILDLAKKKQLNIQVGFIERYNPAIITLKNILHSTQKIINIDFIRTNKMSSRITDVNVIIDLMIHDIDLALSLNGEVSEIYAKGVIINDMIEYARAILTHKNGAFSNIVASRITEKRIRQISVTTESEYIDCNLLSKEVFVSKQSVEQRLDNVSIVAKTESIDVRGQEALLSELIDFTHLCNSTPPHHNYPNQYDGMKAMEIAYSIENMIRG